MLTALIMAGGAGTRFWPMSREKNPKQYLKIVSDNSMIRMTFDRLTPILAGENAYVVTSELQSPLVKRELPELPAQNIILEPFGMNTAPAIGLSAMLMSRRYKGDDIMLVLPSDHVIKDTDKFCASIAPAMAFANNGYLVTFGIKPSYPATGFGYIESGNNLGAGFEVRCFKEKPDSKTAAHFIEKGNYYWNSGMFVWRIDAILAAYKELAPEIYALLTEINALWDKEGENADISALYSKMPKIPVDVGIMERSARTAVIPVDYGWSDVGGWKALMEMEESDPNGNVLLCNSEVIDSKSNYVHSGKMVALIGVNNLIVVETPDAILIADRDKSEQVKEIVNALRRKKLSQYL
jgi:mannose-1-phosphate guanylyltransferase